MPLMSVAAIFIAGTLATFTDWLFMGVLFHDRYNRHPEVWRPSAQGKGSQKTIIYSSALDYVTAAAVVALCIWANTHGVAEALALAVLAYVAGPLVVAVTNAMWIKIDPRVTLAHALGYLARFVIAGIAAGVVLK